MTKVSGTGRQPLVIRYITVYGWNEQGQVRCKFEVRLNAYNDLEWRRFTQQWERECWKRHLVPHTVLPAYYTRDGQLERRHPAESEYEDSQEGMWKQELSGFVTTPRGESKVSSAHEVPFVPEQKVVNGQQYPTKVTVASKSNPDETWEVTIFDADGTAFCPCQGFHYRQSCRHTRQAREELGLS